MPRSPSDPLDLVGVHGRHPVRRPVNSWGEQNGGSPGSDLDSRSESQYTDADSVASDAFESGAEEISDDEGGGGGRRVPRASRGARRVQSFDASDDLARDMRGVSIGDAGIRDSRDAAETTSTHQSSNDFTEAEVREAFGAFDEDGDGYLDVHDVQSFFEALGETLTVHETAELIKLVDKNDDGLVDFDEFFDLATRSAQFVNT